MNIRRSCSSHFLSCSHHWDRLPNQPFSWTPIHISVGLFLFQTCRERSSPPFHFQAHVPSPWSCWWTLIVFFLLCTGQFNSICITLSPESYCFHNQNDYILLNQRQISLRQGNQLPTFGLTLLLFSLHTPVRQVQASHANTEHQLYIRHLYRGGFFSSGAYISTVWALASLSVQFSSVQSFSRVRLFETPWIAARQASLSITNSRSSLRLMSIKSVMPSSHLILCRRPLLLLPPIPPSIRVFSNESTLRMRWPKYWSFSFSIIPSKELSGLISFRMDWLDLLTKDKSRVREVTCPWQIN